MDYRRQREENLKALEASQSVTRLRRETPETETPGTAAHRRMSAEEWNRIKEGRPTVRELKAALADVPDDAVWWAYEGEVSGLIVSHPNGSWVLHNDGDVEREKS